jgi:cell division protein FtsL
MKRSAKPLIMYAFFLIVTGTVLVLGFVGIKIENEVLTKQKLSTEEKTNSLKNERINLIAEYQNYSSEERVLEIAMQKLNMIRPTEPAEIKFANKEKIEMINKIISEKYE